MKNLLGDIENDKYDSSLKNENLSKHEKKKINSSLTKRAFVYLKSNAYTLLNVASEISTSLPDKQDNIFTGVIKIANIINKIMAMGDKRSKMQIICNKHDVVFKNNKHFVNMFVSTGMLDVFDVIDRDPIEDHQAMLVLKHQDIGNIILIEVDLAGEYIYRDVFFHSKNVDFKKLSQIIWDKNDGRIDVSSIPSIGGEEYGYSTFPYPNPPAFGGALERLKELKEKHNRIVVDNISRTYLFLGKPGTGKTTLALRFATESGGKIIRMSANLLHNTSESNLKFLFDVLSPNFIIVDDIDKAHSYKIPELLTTLDHIKQTNSNVSIVLTANKTEEMEESFLRPGRIDTIVRFDLPNKNERLDILKGYAKIFNVNISDEALNTIAEKSESMTGAWLKEVSIQLKYTSFDEVIKYIDDMNSFVEKYSDDSEEPELDEEE